MFTCPICDWRVKIPRDAARPKLEDLQSWQDEVDGLPFQPEEEEVLRKIVDKASAFRDFLSQYTNGNQLCRTMEEMPEMLFYLRKIEGAEVLLAYETNVFRQELHKWQPIAPGPPPIQAQSLSTRKPRPTKQQKLMKEMGIEKLEDLPPHLRTKTYARRKTQDSFASGSGPHMSRVGDGQSPAGGSTSSPGHSGPGRSATPSANPRTVSTGNAPNGGFESSYLPDRAHAGTPYESSYPVPGSGYAANSPSPLFSPGEAPAGFRDGDSRNQDPSFPLFRPSSLGIDPEDDLRNGLAGSSGHGSARDNSPHVGGYGDIFMDDANGRDDPVPSLEHEASHASEALEMMANNDNEDDDGAIEGVDKEFEGFLDGAGDPGTD